MRSERLKRWLEAACAGNPAAPAIYSSGKTSSYAELDEGAEVFAQHLEAAGVDAGDIVALITTSSWLTALLFHASSKLGAVLYPIDPKMPIQWRPGLLEQAGVDHVIRYEADEALFDIDVRSLEISTMNRAAIARKGETGVAVIVATSGSSGEPKGVMLGHESLHASVEAVNTKLGLVSGDCWLNCLPLYHVGGLSIVFRTARAGASMVLHQGFDAVRVWKDMKRFPVTHISLVPAMLAMLLDEARGAPPERLRTLLVGGAAMSKKLARRTLEAGWPLYVSYGMSEASSQVATRCLTDRGEFDSADGHTMTLLPDVECVVVDETGSPTKGVGQIRLRGRCLMRGYVNPEKKVGDGLDGQGWFTTGDLGTLDVNNCIRIVGRADETLISGGENIHPHEVEMLMLGCSGIDAVCVIGVEDSVWGHKVCAVYTGRSSEPEVEQWCRDAIKGALRPRKLVRLERLPCLSNGKIDRVNLKREFGVEL